MKKIILALTLAALIILYGFVLRTEEFHTAAAEKPPSPAEAAEQLISKMQSDAKTHTFECFTGKSNYADCLALIDIQMALDSNVRYKYNGPVVTFSAELLGCPARLNCGFNRSERLSSLYYIIDLRGEADTPEELTAKLCDELGDYQTLDRDGRTFYVWRHNGWEARLEHSIGDTGAVDFAHLAVDATDSEYVSATPDIFHFKLGTDAGTVCRGKITGLKPIEGRLLYYDRDVSIYMQFKPDETGALKLHSAKYNVVLNKMSVEEGLDYFESLADGLETAVGKADSRGYVIHVDPSKGQAKIEGCTAQDVRDSGETSYYFKMEWPGISLLFQKIGVTNLEIEFSEEYFNAQ